MRLGSRSIQRISRTDAEPIQDRSRVDSMSIHGRFRIATGPIQGCSRIDPGSIQGRSRVDPGSIHGRSRVDPGSIQGRSSVEPGSIQDRSKTDRSIQGRKRVDPPSIQGRTRIDAGSIHRAGTPFRTDRTVITSWWLKVIHSRQLLDYPGLVSRNMDFSLEQNWVTDSAKLGNGVAKNWVTEFQISEHFKKTVTQFFVPALPNFVESVTQFFSSERPIFPMFPRWDKRSNFWVAQNDPYFRGFSRDGANDPISVISWHQGT